MATNNCSPWWTGTSTNPAFSRSRISRSERLALLQLSEAEFELYKDLFLRFRQRSVYAERRDDGSWPQFKHTWKDSLVLRHLCGQTYVAIPFGNRVDQIVLDIDFKGSRQWREVEDTVRLCHKALPGEPVVHQSSETLGIRMIWFLNRPVSRAALHEWAKNTLNKAGVIVAPGKCEVRLGAEPDRLPFGRGSMLLDITTLEPQSDLDLSQTIRIVNDHRKLHSVDPPTLLPTHDTQNNHTEYKKIVNACLHGGLPSDVSTNQCLLALAWHERARLGLEKDEVKVFLQDWVSTHHNGNSNRMNKGKIDSIYSQIDRIVDGLLAEPGGRRHTPNKPVGLTESELRYLLDLPGDFKTLGGLFRLLCFTKTRFKESLPRKTTDSALLGKKKGTNKWSRVLRGDNGIPNGAGNYGVWIDLPVEVLRRLHVPNSENTAYFVREMERIGILKLKRQAWPYGHKARQYWVNFPFDLTGQPLSSSFDEVLWTVLGFDGIGDRFTRYQAERIAKVVGFQKREKPVAVHRSDVKEVQSDSTART